MEAAYRVEAASHRMKAVFYVYSEALFSYRGRKAFPQAVFCAHSEALLYYKGRKAFPQTDFSEGLSMEETSEGPLWEEASEGLLWELDHL